MQGTVQKFVMSRHSHMSCLLLGVPPIMNADPAKLTLQHMSCFLPRHDRHATDVKKRVRDAVKRVRSPS